MFKTIGMACLIATVSASSVFAGDLIPIIEKDLCKADHNGFKFCMTAPEIDPASAMAGLTLLAGGVAVILGRRSRRLSTQAE